MTSFHYFGTPVSPEYKKKFARNVGIGVLILFALYGVINLTISTTNPHEEKRTEGFTENVKNNAVIEPLNILNYSVKISENLNLESKKTERLPKESGFAVKITGTQQVRGGTTHDINIQVTRDDNPVNDAKIRITIEDYGKEILREFKGRTDSNGKFVFSWEAPKFDDIKTLLAYIDATDDISAKTVLFKFSVYCLPGETGCKMKGN